jgi:hypothetical protein
MSAPKVFICHDCGKRFNSHSAMNMHVKAMATTASHKPQMYKLRRKSILRRIMERIFRKK